MIAAVILALVALFSGGHPTVYEDHSARLMTPQVLLIIPAFDSPGDYITLTIAP